jgi:hypothetical protein
MRNLSRLVSCLVACGLAVAKSSNVQASSVVLDNVTRGYYVDNGFANAGPTGSYLVGQDGNTYRDFFIFDTGGLTNITSATLQLYVPTAPSQPNRPGFIDTVGSSETFELTAVSTPVSILTNPNQGFTAGNLAVYDMLGAGTVVGATNVSVSNQYVDVQLNASGIADLNSAAGQFAISGVIAGLTGNPADTQAEFEYSGIYGSPDWVRLELNATEVPEPAALTLLGSGLSWLIVIRQRRRSER